MIKFYCNTHHRHKDTNMARTHHLPKDKEAAPTTREAPKRDGETEREGERGREARDLAKYISRFKNNEIWDTTEVKQRSEWEALIPQDRDFETDTKQAVRVVKRTELTSSGTGIAVVKPIKSGGDCKPETAFPEPRGGGGCQDQITNQRGFRCYQAGKNAGCDFC